MSMEVGVWVGAGFIGFRISCLGLAYAFQGPVLGGRTNGLKSLKLRKVDPGRGSLW